MKTPHSDRGFPTGMIRLVLGAGQREREEVAALGSQIVYAVARVCYSIEKGCVFDAA